MKFFFASREYDEGLFNALKATRFISTCNKDANKPTAFVSIAPAYLPFNLEYILEDIVILIDSDITALLMTYYMIRAIMKPGSIEDFHEEEQFSKYFGKDYVSTTYPSDKDSSKWNRQLKNNEIKYDEYERLVRDNTKKEEKEYTSIENIAEKFEYINVYNSKVEKYIENIISSDDILNKLIEFMKKKTFIYLHADLIDNQDELISLLNDNVCVNRFNMSNVESYTGAGSLADYSKLNCLFLETAYSPGMLHWDNSRSGIVSPSDWKKGTYRKKGMRSSYISDTYIRQVFL